MRAKNLLISLGVLTAVGLWINWDIVETSARDSIASAAGKAAVANLSGVVAGNNTRGLAAAELITLPVEVDEVSHGIFRASGVRNTFVIVTSAGNVVFDTGLIIQASEQIRKLKDAVGDNEPAKNYPQSQSCRSRGGHMALVSGRNTTHCSQSV